MEKEKLLSFGEGMAFKVEQQRTRGEKNERNDNSGDKYSD